MPETAVEGEKKSGNCQVVRYCTGTGCGLELSEKESGSLCPSCLKYDAGGD
tara:strand:+ start:3160 stop:3312 length:153 start_codon:yes stop_codon:yes gene_type:complete